MTHLTREQLAAIHAAKKAGVTKKELFQMDLQKRKFKSLPFSEREKIAIKVSDEVRIRQKQHDREIVNRFFAEQLGRKISQPNISDAERAMTDDKILAMVALQKDKKAKEAFIQKQSLRLSEEQAMKLK
jgi:hypothetical protein